MKNCFNADSLIQLTDTQIEAVKAWIEKCHARMPCPSLDARNAKKQKLGHSHSVYTGLNFVAMPSLPACCRAPDLPVGPPGARSAVEPADLHARRGMPHPPERPPAASPTGGPRPTIATQLPPSGTAAVKFALTLKTVLDSPPTAAPMRRQLTPSIHSTLTTMAIAGRPDKGRSPNNATSNRTAVPLESIAPEPPPQPTQSRTDAATRSLFAPSGKSSTFSLPSLPFPSPPAAFRPLLMPRLADALDALLAYRHRPTRPSEFHFEWYADAAAHNWELL